MVGHIRRRIPSESARNKAIHRNTSAGSINPTCNRRITAYHVLSSLISPFQETRSLKLGEELPRTNLPALEKAIQHALSSIFFDELQRF